MANRSKLINISQLIETIFRSSKQLKLLYLIARSLVGVLDCILSNQNYFTNMFINVNSELIVLKKSFTLQAGQHPGKLSSALISIRVSHPWIMGRALWGTCLHHTIRFRVITHSAISCGTGGWRCRIAFPWCKVFDVFQRSGIHDPIECLRNGYHPHVTHG